MNTAPTNSSSKWHWIIMGIGMLLSLIQYLFNRSLWGDEAMLALNIIEKPAAQLLEPLSYHQVAPILFLLLEKCTALLLPNSELGLRLIPLLSFWLSMYVFRKLSLLILHRPFAQLTVLALFAINASLIYFSSEVKQYMTDVLVSTTCLYVVARPYTWRYGKMLSFMLTGIVSVWLSNVAPIILTSCGLWWLLSSKQPVKQIPALALSGLVIGSMFLFYFLRFIYHHPSQAFMLEFWEASQTFLPANPLSAAFYHFLAGFVQELFFSTLRFKALGIILLLLFVTGIFHLFRTKKYYLVVVFIMPFVLHLILSALHMYPVSRRLLLYGTPLLLLMIGFGIEQVQAYRSIPALLQYKSLIFATIPVILIAIVFLIGFPIRRDEIKPNLLFLNNHIQPGDKIYVHRMAQYAFQYYHATEYFRANNEVRYGNSDQQDNIMLYVSEITAVPAPTWLVSTHNAKGEISGILKALDSMGKKPITIARAHGSVFYKFDLRESTTQP